MANFGELLQQMQDLQNEESQLRSRRGQIEDEIDQYRQKVENLYREQKMIDQHISQVEEKQRRFTAAMNGVSAPLPPNAPASPRIKVDLTNDDSSSEDILVDATPKIETPNRPPQPTIAPPPSAAQPAPLSAFTTALVYTSRDAGSIHEYFPSVVAIDGRWVEILCRICNGNWSTKGRRNIRPVKGMKGLLNHYYSHNTGVGGYQLPIHKERVVSEEDVERMLKGEQPGVAIVNRPFGEGV